LLPTLFRFYSYVFPFVFFDPPFPQFLDDFHYDRPYLFFWSLFVFFDPYLFFFDPSILFFWSLFVFWSLSQTWSSWYFYGISIRYFHKIFDISMVYLIYVGVYVYIYVYPLIRYFHLSMVIYGNLWYIYGNISFTDMEHYIWTLVHYRLMAYH
jgi:hypothetical protein